MPSLLLIQSGLVVFFVLVHFIIGFFRGTVKSTYYLLVSVVLSLVILGIVSGISVGAFYSPEALVDLIQSNTGNAIPEAYVEVISQPEVVSYVFAIVDVIVRIVAFFVLYTVIRFILSFVVFGLLWKKVLKSKVNTWLKLSNFIVKEGENEPKTKLFFKRYKSPLNRLGGAFIGAFKGLITAFVLLLPLLVLATTTENLSFNEQGEASVGDTLIPDEVIEIIELVNELNENNFSRFFGNLGNGLFDFAFETKMGSSNFNLRDELNVVTEILNIAYNKGYLNNNFDVESINSTDITTIKSIFQLISQSILISEGLTLGSDILVAGLLEDELGFSFEGRLGDASFNTLASLDWQEELVQLAVVIEKVLTFGSVQELIDLLGDTDSILDLTVDEASDLADVLRAVADLQLVKLIGAGIDYATTLDDAKNIVEWLNVNEREAYLQDILVDLISNTEFFFGEDGDLYNLADLLEVLFAEYGDFALAQLLEDDLDISSLLNDDVQAFAEATLQSVAQVETVVTLLPLVFDIGLYGALEADDASLLSDDLQQALETINVSAEFRNATDIYQTLIQLAAARFLEDDVELIALLDDVIANNLDDVRTLVDQVLVKSVLVNSVLENGVSIALELAVSDTDLRELLEAILYENGSLAIDLGAELVLVLDLLETLSEVTDLVGLTEALADQELLIDLVDKIALHNTEETKQVVEALFDLKLIDRVLNHAFEDVLTFLLDDQETLDLALLFAEDGALVIDIESDVKDVLDILALGYTFTSVRNLLESLETLDINTAVALADAFGSVSQENALELVSLITGLSLIDALHGDVLEDVASFLGFETLYVADDVNLQAEITNILLPVYLTAQFVHEQLKLHDAKDIVFTPLLNTLKPYFMSSQNNQLIVQNFAYNLEGLIVEFGLEAFLYVPRTLAGASPESVEWSNEYDDILGSIFSLLDILSAEVILSNQQLSNTVDRLNTIDILAILELFNTEAKVEDAIGTLLNSKIVRASLPVIVLSFEDALEGFMPGYLLHMPELAMQGELVKEDALLGIISPLLSIVFDGMVGAKFEHVQDALDALEIMDTFELYDFIYGTKAVDFDRLASNDLIRGLISDMLLDNAFALFAQGLVEDALDMTLTTAFKLERDHNVLSVEELQAVFTILHDLALPKSLIITPDGRISLISDAVFGYIQSIGEAEFKVLFDNFLINDLLTSLLHDTGLAQFAQDFFDDAVGSTLENLNTSLGLSTPLELDIAGFVEGFVNITNEHGHFALRELVPFIEAYQKLENNRYVDLFLNDFNYFLEVYGIVTTNLHVAEALSSRFITYPLGFIFSDEVFAASITNIVNSLTSDLGHTFEQDAFAFDDYLFQTNGDLKVDYVVQIAAALIAILDIDQGFTIDALLGLGEVVTIFGQTETILDHILDAEVLFQIIDKITIEQDVLVGFATILENIINEQIELTGLDDILAENGLLTTVSLYATALPSIALDRNGRFSRVEIRTLLNVFSALEMTTFEQLSVLSTTEGIYNTIKNTLVIEALLTSNWLNFIVNSGLNNPSLYQGLATSIEELIFDQFNILVDIDPSIFDITEDKYNIFNEVDGELFIKASEVKHLLLTLLAIDTTEVTFGAGLEVIDGIYDLLELEDDNGISFIDNILQSRIILALFDKLLNFEVDASNLKPVLTAVLNRVLADVLDGNILDNDILDMRNITTSDGVIAASEIKALLYLGKLIDTNAVIGLDLLFDLFTEDNNNNENSDFEDIFASNIILSIISNVVANASVRQGATAFFENAANDTLSSIALFDGFVFDASKLVLIFDALTDDEGSFDYSQLRRLFNILQVLGLNSQQALNDFELGNLFDNVLKDLYEANLEARNGIRYLAETELFRALMDALILEQDQGYAWGLQTIISLITGNEVLIYPVNLSMIDEMRALDDNNGLVRSQHVYEFLLAILTQDLRGLVGFDGNIEAVLESFTDKPLDDSDFDRIDFLFNSQIIEILLSGILDNNDLDDQLGMLVSDLLKETLLEMGYDVQTDLFDDNGVGLTFDLVNESALRHLVRVLRYFNLESLDDLAALADPYVIFRALNFPTDDTLLMDTLETPILNHVLKLVFNHSNLNGVAQEVIDIILRQYSVNVSVHSPIFSLPFAVSDEDLYDLIQSIYMLGLFDFENYGLLSVGYFTDILDSNIDLDSGDDDFDRVLESRILYTLLNNIALIEEIQEIINAYAPIYFGFELSSVDFTMPESVIGDMSMEIELIEVGRITKSAWRDLFTSIRALNLDEALENSTLGLALITDLIDLDNQDDDGLRTFLASDILYVLLARIIDNEIVGNQITELLPEELLDLLGVFSINSPVDARVQRELERLFSRDEMYLLVRSIKLLNLDFENLDPNLLGYIFNLIDSNILNGVDDFDRFIASKYIQDKLSNILLSETIIDLIAQELFTSEDFYDTLPETAWEDFGIIIVMPSERLSAAEFRKLFVSLQTLGLTDLTNVSFGIETLTALSEGDLTDVLASDYVYTIIHLILSNQDAIAIPESSIETGGDFDGMIKKSEITNILKALAILGDDLENIDINSLTIADLEELFDLNSSLVDSLLTTGIEEVVSVPIEAYDDATTISRFELRAILDTLLLISDDDDTTLLSAIDPANVTFTVTLIRNIVALNSIFAESLISENMLDVLDVPAGAINIANGVILGTEITKVLDALDILGISTLSGDISVDEVSIGDLQDLLNLSSLIINRLISKAIVDSGLSVPTRSFVVVSGDVTNDILTSELQAIVDTLLLIFVVDTTLLSDIDVETVTFTVTLIEDLSMIVSDFTQALLSENIIGLIDVPARAIDSTLGYDNVTEIKDLIDALDILGITTLDGDISVDLVTVGQFKDLVALNSFIVDRLLSGIILNSELSVPTASLDTLGDITKDTLRSELIALQDTLLILSDNNMNVDVNTLLSTLDASLLSPTMLQDLLDLESPLVNRIISSGIIETNKVVADQYAVLGDSNYDANAINKDLKLTELAHIIASLELIGLSAVSDVVLIQLDDILGLSDNDIDALLGGTTTFMYYIFEDIVDTNGSIIITAYELANGPLGRDSVTGRIERTDLIALLKYDPVILRTFNSNYWSAKDADNPSQYVSARNDTFDVMVTILNQLLSRVGIIGTLQNYLDQDINNLISVSVLYFNDIALLKTEILVFNTNLDVNYQDIFDLINEDNEYVLNNGVLQTRVIVVFSSNTP